MMFYLYLMLWLLTVHFVADFVLQSNWMAQGKSKSNKPLVAHVCVYTATLAVGSVPMAALSGHVGLYAIWVFGNGALHFATDFVTSRINSRLWEAKRVHGFFVGVGADQLIHTWTLGLTTVWLLR